MKIKSSLIAFLLAMAVLLPAAASAQLKLTGASIFGVGLDGQRTGACWNTIGGDSCWNVYFFTGPPLAPQFLNSGNTAASLNPNFELAPGTYTFGFVFDRTENPGYLLELNFNGSPQTGISVLTHLGDNGKFSGATTFTTAGTTVTLTAIQIEPARVDAVGAFDNKPDGSPDLVGIFTLVVTSKKLSRVAAVAPLAPVTLNDFKLTGDLSGEMAAFTLTANAQVTDARGGTLELLSGPVALTELKANQKWQLTTEQNRFIAKFDHRGTFPVELHFHAAVTRSNDWSAVNFQVATSALQPVTLQGLPADTEFQFANAARPDRAGSNFVSHLPVDGTVKFAWKQSRAAAEGKLFYAAEMISQISVSPGLMRQLAQFSGKIMQGEMNRLVLQLHGAGEVTRIQGDAVLAWQVDPGTNAADRRLVVQFNQPQKEAFAVLVQMQTPLGAFPQTAAAMQVSPEGATRFAGSIRIVNDGAVRLEVLSASGLSQISPDQFPEPANFHATGTQRFAYRFSSADFALKIQADQILPEIGVAQVLAYNLGENELAVDAEIELDIREAPLRELRLNIPSGYAIAKLTAPGLSDYFTSESPAHDGAELRLVYGQPVADRQVIQLRLERNQSLGETNWTLPHIEVAKAKSVRGFVGVSADNGFRLTTERSQSLTEIATAFFPRQLPGIQSAFRLSEASWSATLRVERLPQTVQADVFHLFSIGEGIAYGSSVMNYVVSGAPVSVFRVELSPEYFNVEFTGKDIRNWEKTTNGFIVQLHTPVAGAYTLLATYERPFKPQGETLAFTGARPLDAQSESGHTIVISAYQFQVTPADVSSGLLPLEPGEVPAEYRLFFDKPVLAAYRYSARPFNLKLALSPLAQGDSLGQVVDRAALTTHVSKEGQALTDVHYLVKNRGNPNFRVTLPAGTQLWSATVNGASVVPVMDDQANLIPLPQHADPDTVLTIDLKLAGRSPVAKKLTLIAPSVAAPVMLAEWKLEPDEGQRLVYQSGTLAPANGAGDISGFAQLARMAHGAQAGGTLRLLLMALFFLALAIVVWRWAAGPGVEKFSPRHLLGAVIGLVAMLIAASSLMRAAGSLDVITAFAPDTLAFLAPVQQANSTLTVEVANLTAAEAATNPISRAWPVLAAVAVWIFAWRATNPVARAAGAILGWTLLAWAALRLPNGAFALSVVFGAFLLLHVVLPSLKQLWRVPSAPKPNLPPTAGGPATTAVTLLAGLCLLGGAMSGHSADASTVLPESVTQEIRIEDQFALATAKIHWTAEKGQVLPLLFEPAVLTRLNQPKGLKLERAPAGSRNSQQLVAQAGGTFDIEVQYQVQVTKRDGDGGLTLAVPGGLINRATLSLANLDVDVFSPQAVSVQRSSTSSNTVATLVLSPGGNWIGWKPRSRDVKREKAVFYAEISQLYVPSAGVVEGVHQVSLRPAQGELSEVIFNVPAGATITDVADAADVNRQPATANAPSLVSLWRFDPDTRKLRVTLNPAQSKPFQLTIRSQVATGTLPFEQRVGLLSAEGAAGQIGLVGIATGSEVQLDDVGADQVSAINLEDFPASVAQTCAVQFPGLTVRRAFRYAEPSATVLLKASPVEPDVRVETQDTLSLGEDRTVLASTATVAITRAGIFRLSFLMPAGFDVEAISGPALSHWTELKTAAGRVITLNLTGKTEGQQQFIISLSGRGVKSSRAWTVPQLVLREAGKQRGTLLVVPEQGMRLQVATRAGVTQLDPQKSGIRQKGVLAFRILETPWQLALDLEQVDPWIQVTSLQHATVNEAQVKITANLQYQIENTGLKAFRVLLPANAEGVVFHGDQLADFLAVEGAVTNGLQAWDIKLHRRVIGQYLLQVNYQTPIAGLSGETVLRGVLAAEVNLQRGFATVQSAGRLQVRVDNLPATLQATEWQGIPRALQKDLPAVSASFAYRLVEADFQLPLKLERHEAAKLLPARVNNITFTSVISDAGVMLTQVRLELLPGDKRLLHLTLPKDAKFWFAFVNQNGVWPWRDGEQILIPLEQPSRGDQPVPVEIFFSSTAGLAGANSLDLDLLAPKFDLPLENLTWRVFLNDKWQVKKWSGALQLSQQEVVANASTLDLQGYLQNETSLQQEKTKEAEQMLALGNSALQKGDPQSARRAFQSAYGLSRNDLAFNEDARVQLNNLKLQQALVGLNVRQSIVSGANTAVSGKLLDLRNKGEANYTQQDARQIIDNNSADENTAFMKLAERIIQQQDAAVANPAVIRANIPEQGQLLTFKRAVVVDTWADLNIGLKTRTATAASGSTRLMVLGLFALVLALLAGLGWIARMGAKS